ncbi:MAG: uroporphyrinogen decarboxylase [Candidatus Puniceispirillum sp.]
MNGFLKTLAGQKMPIPPIWMMRQAGRYLKEYRDVRETTPDFISFCLDAEKASNVTIQPITRFGFDAAIIFSDILMVPWALERNVRFKPNHGPMLDPLADSTALDESLLDDVAQKLAPVADAITRTRKLLRDDTALIGFAGAPWTVMTYMIEGGSSKDFNTSRQMLWNDPAGFDRIMQIVTQATIEFLSLQAKAGADALMLFDSWASAVPAWHRDAIVNKPAATIIDSLRARGITQPVIGFPKGIGEGILPYADQVNINALGLDHGMDIRWAHKNLPASLPVQGNLDPISLIAGGDDMCANIDDILAVFADRPHIFNLGHGITPATPIANVTRMVSHVRQKA